MLIHHNLKQVLRGNNFIWMCIFAIIAWLFWGAAIINIETADGYSTIQTSQYFLGLSEHYGFQRGPFLALYLIPAEWISNILNLHPLDVRAHHYSTALLNSLYIISTWLLLKKYYQNDSWVVGVAFLLTIPSFIFFSYGIFISSDIFPGIILISMILLTFEFQKTSSLSILLSLVALGFLAVTIKQTYAIFWISIIISSFIFYSRKTFIQLLLAATASAILSWLTYAWFLSNVIPVETSWWMAPLEQINFVNKLYHSQDEDMSQLFAWWLYLRNFYNYGLIASSLILPAIIYALFLRKIENNNYKILAITWLICFIFMQIISFKEVRYLAYLSPLSAFLLVPILSALLNSKFKNIFIPILIIFSIFDLTQNTNEALRINNEFYQGMVKNYFNPLDELHAKKIPRKVLMINSAGFTPNIFSPLNGDRYHRLFHIPDNILHELYNFKNISYMGMEIHLNNIENIKINSSLFSSGDILIFSNQNLVRQGPWNRENTAITDDSYIQFIAVSIPVTLIRNHDRFDIESNNENNKHVLLLNDKNHKYKMLLNNKGFSISSLSKLIDNSLLEQNKITVTGFYVSRLCNKYGCFNMEYNSEPLY